MALIVKSSIDILPWTEIEKQKLIEDKKDFLSKKAEKENVEVEETEVTETTEAEEVKKEVKEEVEETEVAEENKKS